MSVELKTYLTGLTADGSPDAAADYVITYDASADELKKALIEDLGGGGGGLSGLGSTDNAALRANGTGGTSAQGSLMTIDDNGAPTIPDQQYYTCATKRLIGYNSAAPAMNINVDGVTTLTIYSGSGGSIGFQDTPGNLFGKFDGNSTAGNTRLLIWDVDNANLERVSVGAADSGGSGFKVLRIAN
jgi:hypothetical protein